MPGDISPSDASCLSADDEDGVTINENEHEAINICSFWLEAPLLDKRNHISFSSFRQPVPTVKSMQPWLFKQRLAIPTIWNWEITTQL